MAGRFFTPGTGGGTHSTASGVAAPKIPRLTIPVLAASGGNGGGCETSCSGSSAHGGNGGGGLWMEVRGNANLDTGIVKLLGNNGTNGSAGGGGGSFTLIYGTLTQNATDIQVSGGLSTGVPPTNCHQGGNGAPGRINIVPGF